MKECKIMVLSALAVSAILGVDKAPWAAGQAQDSAQNFPSAWSAFPLSHLQPPTPPGGLPHRSRAARPRLPRGSVLCHSPGSRWDCHHVWSPKAHCSTPDTTWIRSPVICSSSTSDFSCRALTLYDDIFIWWLCDRNAKGKLHPSSVHHCIPRIHRWTEQVLRKSKSSLC